MASPLDLDDAAGDADGSASDIDCDLVEYTLPLGDSSMRPPGHSEYAADADSVRPPNCTVPKPFLTYLADQAKHTSVGGGNMLAGGSSGDSRANSRSTTMANPAAKPGGGGGSSGGSGGNGDGDGDSDSDGDDNEKNQANIHGSGGSSSLVAPKNLKLKPLLLVSNAPPPLPPKP